jgi:hypothetical protein
LAHGPIIACQGQRAKGERAEECGARLAADLDSLFRVRERFHPPSG